MKTNTYKYSPLEEYILSINDNEIKFTFDEIEKILGKKLPPTAYKNRAWWTYNDATHTQSKAWTSANFKPQVALKDRYIIFKRVDNNE